MWQINNYPFKHLYIKEVFSQKFYTRISKTFTEKMANVVPQSARYLNYDATISELRDGDCEHFLPLLDISWLSLVCRAMRLDPRMEVAAALHQHPPGSRSGWIHSDYNPGWFTEQINSKTPTLVDPRCDYRTGETAFNCPAPVQRMRHVALIYYLNNDNWRAGMGGETALYSSRHQDPNSPDVLVPPLNNSLIAFECTPFSWHSFRYTSVQRCSVSMWLHREWKSALAQWPNHEPAYW